MRETPSAQAAGADPRHGRTLPSDDARPIWFGVVTSLIYPALGIYLGVSSHAPVGRVIGLILMGLALFLHSITRLPRWAFLAIMAAALVSLLTTAGA